MSLFRWGRDHRPGRSLSWAMSLPKGPLIQHLTSLHALLVYSGATDEAMEIAEHHLREIGVATAEQPRPGEHKAARPLGIGQLGWQREAHEHFAETIQPFIADQVQKNNDAIETMCERMLTQEGTNYGVLVKNMKDGTVEVSLSPKVLFGQIGYTREGASE